MFVGDYIQGRVISNSVASETEILHTTYLTSASGCTALILHWNNNIIQQGIWLHIYYTEGHLTSALTLRNSIPCCKDSVIRNPLLQSLEHRETEMGSARSISSLSSFYTRTLQRETGRFLIFLVKRGDCVWQIYWTKCDYLQYVFEVCVMEEMSPKVL